MNARERDYDRYVTRPDLGPVCSSCDESHGEEKCDRCGKRFCPECLESHEREHREEDAERRRDMSIDAGMEAAKEASEMSATTQEALKLLRRLRERADQPNLVRRPMFSDLRPAGAGLRAWLQSGGPALARQALSLAGYFEASEQPAWHRAIDAAVAKLEGQT